MLVNAFMTVVRGIATAVLPAFGLTIKGVLEIKDAIVKTGQFFGLWEDVATDSAKKVGQWVSDVTAELAKETADSAEAMTRNYVEMTEQINFKMREAGSGFESAIGDMVGTAGSVFSDGIDEMEDKILDFSVKISDMVKKHSEGMAQIQKDIEQTTKDYEAEGANQEEAYKQNIANIIKSHQDKVAQLQQQLREETAFGQTINEEKVAGTQAELEKELNFLAKHASDVQEVQSELAMDEIDIAKANYEKEKATRKTEYENRLAELKEQLNKENNEYANSLRDLGLEFKDKFDDIRNFIATSATPEIVSAFQQMVSLVNAELAKVNAQALTSALTAKTTPATAPTTIAPAVGTTPKAPTTPIVVAPKTITSATTSPITTALKSLSSMLTTTASATTSLISQIGGVKTTTPMFQFGGIVPKTGLAMVHEGEAVIPRNKVERGMATSNVNVNFYGGMTITNEADEDRLVNKIRSVLMRDFEMAARGLY
jgi:hypothetical protein